MRILAIAATVVLIVLSGAAIVGAFAVLARRLLGLGFGLVRLVLAGPIFQAMSGTVAARGSAITRCGSSSWRRRPRCWWP
jgi:hypothetical protein